MPRKFTAFPWFWRRRRLVTAVATGTSILSLGAIIASLLIPLETASYLRAPSSLEVFSRDGRLLNARLTDNEMWQFPRPLEHLSERLAQATVAAEDQRFYSHPGVDPIAIFRAFGQNVRNAGIRSGASTITMQLVKLSGRPSSSVLGKIAQAWLALRLERCSTKPQILEAYLNRAPYGLNLVGAEAAARRYFGKPAAELALTEAALLAGLPKSPTALAPLAHPDRALRRRNHVLRRMREEGFITDGELERALNAPLGAAWHDFPRSAEHLVRKLGEQAFENRLSLDAAHQESLEKLLPEYLRQFNHDVTNLAAIVVRIPDRQVLAYAGGADFFGAAKGAQLDLARSPRSPGSALKPFIYALALDRHRLYPCERLLDDTFDLGTYSPANFDGEFNGLVTASDALRYSLNVPAVLVLQRVGVDAFTLQLQNLGFSSVTKPPDFYGLGISLGNCEIRLDELAAAYAAVADSGIWRPLAYSPDLVSSESHQVMTSGAAVTLMRMLEQPLPRENESDRYRARGLVPQVCWKTGTSTGFRDAWAVVFNAHYVVAVWAGNSDGRPSRRLVGIEAALPLASRIFRRLPVLPIPAWPELAQTQNKIDVCAISGLPPGPACTAHESALVPAGTLINRRCAVHGIGRAAPNELRWPATARQWDLARMDISGSGVADHTGNRLAIISPAPESEFVLTGGRNGDRLRLQSNRDEVEPVHWYLDGVYLGVADSASPLFIELTQGSHELIGLSENGATSRARFKVVLPGSQRKLISSGLTSR